MLTVGSLFSGIGGFDLGLERAGMKVSWQIEKYPWCQQVLAKHWPEVTRFGDITEVRSEDLEPVELICGGFPCQPASTAGKRKGTDETETQKMKHCGERSGNHVAVLSVGALSFNITSSERMGLSSSNS